MSWAQGSKTCAAFKCGGNIPTMWPGVWTETGLYEHKRPDLWKNPKCRFLKCVLTLTACVISQVISNDVCTNDSRCKHGRESISIFILISPNRLALHLLMCLFLDHLPITDHCKINNMASPNYTWELHNVNVMDITEVINHKCLSFTWIK